MKRVPGIGWRWAVFGLFCWTLLGWPSVGATPAEVWSRLTIDGIQVGYAHDVSRAAMYQGKPARQVISDWFLTFKRFGVPVRVQGHTEVIHNSQLQPLWFKEVDDAEVLQRSLEAAWDGQAWTVRTGLGDKTATRRWQPERPAYSLAVISQLIMRERHLLAGERRYPIYDFQQLKVVDTPVRVTLAPGPLGNGAVPYARLDYSVQGEQVSEWIDDEGNTLKAAHATFEAYASTQQQAEQFQVKEILPLQSAAVKLAQPLPEPGNIATLKLLVRFPSADLARFLIETDTQRVLERKGGDLLVELRPPPSTDAGSTWLPRVIPSLKPYLAADDHIQAADPEIVAKARAVVAAEKDTRRMAEQLVQWVHSNVTYTLDVLLTSSLATFTTRRGDCKGYSALLTAMARAVGLPAREVFGLAYDAPHQAFAGHAWTEIYLGQWVPFDATAGGQPNATYFQLHGLSPLDALYHIRKMRIEVVGVKEKRM